MGEEQVLHFMGDGEFALQSLLLLLLSSELGQRFTHGIERLFERRHCAHERRESPEASAGRQLRGKLRSHIFKTPHDGQNFRFLQNPVGFFGSQQDCLYELMARYDFPL
jgi:hypothetical protein